MKFSLSVMMIVISLLSGCASQTSEPKTNKLLAKIQSPDSGVMVVAHRACWVEGIPENSLSSIQACIDMGVDIVEIDVAISADGVPVLMHDKTLDRTTTGSGKVTSKTLAELKQLKLKAGAGGDLATITDEKIPTLEEALRVAKNNILINLDVKGDLYTQAFKVVDKIGSSDQILMKMRASPDNPVLVNAPFHGKTLFMPLVGQCDPNKKHKFCNPKLSDVADEYAKYDTVAYEVVFTDIAYMNEGANSIKEAGKRIWVNSLSPNHAAGLVDKDAVNNPEAVWGKIIELGGNIIQTDYPLLLINHLNEHGLR